jgi:hypothetical protein
LREIIEAKQLRRFRQTAQQAILQAAAEAAERADQEGKNMLAEAIRFELARIRFLATPSKSDFT